MPSIDPDKISDIIREVAADKIVPRFQKLAREDVRAKTSPHDLVTIADEEAEIELTRILPDVLPGSVVIGEEAVSAGRVVRDVLKDFEGKVWIVDPVDGTNNFAHGRPTFGTMVALVEKGERLASWIYQIPKQRMISAQRGEGVRVDGKDFVSPTRPEPDADFKTMRGFLNRRFMPPAMRPYIEERIAMLKAADSLMCCAYEYVDILEGRAAFSIYRRIEPWDHLAGALILEEAGFHVRKWDGNVYEGWDVTGGLVNAPSKELWDRVYSNFLEEPLFRLSS